MAEHIRLLVTEHGLCIQFQNLETKHAFLEVMKNEEIGMFTDEEGPHCYIKKYTEQQHAGQFVSPENRLALSFPSEEAKFSFKESLGLNSASFMDMGPGYDEQMHFNTEILPFREGAAMITRIEAINHMPSPHP
ncbi:MAG: hypothetical protein K0U37_03050 [Gammaproteobacteria bacterium]|nr:hypothetical protein [Gammaproteobacteria bacterium]